jgi:CHAT domain-containing protein
MTLPAGQLVRLSLDQRGVDLVVTVFDPEGGRLDEFNRKAEAPVAEPVAFITNAAGTYQIVVRAPGDAGGHYSLGVEELRAADNKDKSHIAAERAFAAGACLQYLRGDKASLGEAAKKFEDALAIWHSAGDGEGESRALGSLGTLYTSLGESKKAVECYSRRLELVRRGGDRRLEPLLLETIGRLYFESLADKQSAADYLGQALRLYRADSRRDAVARTLTALGKLYTKLGDSPEDSNHAVECLTEALGIYRAEGNRYYEGDCLSNLMETLRAKRQPRLAISFGKQAVNIYQELRTGIKDLEKDTQKTFLQSKEETYRTLADLLISEGRLPEAQEVLEMLKEEEYFKFIRGDTGDTSSEARRATRTPEEIEWENRYRQIADKLTALGRERGELMKKEARTAAEERRLAELEESLTISAQAFQKFLDQLLRELSDEMGSSEAAKKRVSDLEETQGLMDDLRELGPGTVALYTLVGEEKYRVILITPDVERAFEYPIKSADLARKVAAFREVLQDPSKDPLPLARELYKIIVGPVAKDLNDAGAETLMWSLDGVLRYIPVAALNDGDHYLVENYRNVIITPASMARLKDQPSEKWRGLGFGVSKAHEDFNALPAVPKELSSIIRDSSDAGGEGILPGKAFLDEAFTEESLKTMLRQRYPVVHIASHFAFLPGDETNSFLLLGDGGHLLLSQIKTSLNFGGVELLTLSACNTATGGAGADGREVEGFSTLAQQRGAKAVIASLWSVADQSTQLLMRRFYETRQSNPGTSKAEALRLAQLSLLRGDSTGRIAVGRGQSGGAGNKDATGADTRGIAIKAQNGDDKTRGLTNMSSAKFSHPFFWAPFMLTGNWK